MQLEKKCKLFKRNKINIKYSDTEHTKKQQYKWNKANKHEIRRDPSYAGLNKESKNLNHPKDNNGKGQLKKDSYLLGHSLEGTSSHIYSIS